MLGTGAVLAQDTGTISGTVVDSTTSETLPGVNIVVEGEGVGAATDAEGEFEIANVPAGEQTLSASYVGYTTKSTTVTVTANQTTTVNIQMVPEAVGLDDVVVTALGQERAERAISTSVQEVEGAEIDRVDNENFINTLKGKVSGASIQSSNTMAGSSNITIRGYSSIEGSNQPLIVVDGVVIDNRRGTDSGSQNQGYGGFDYGNAAQSLNPNNIQSISVLKGPSAAALYGSRGANGVIQITTKDGARGEDELGVTFSSGVTLTEAYNFMNYQNEYGGGAANSTFSTLDGDYRLDGEDDQFVAQYAVDESWGPRLDGRPVRQWYSWDDVNGLEGQATPWEAHPDAIKDFLRTGTTYNNNIALSQQQEGYNYRLSLSTRNQSGVMPNSNLNRYQVQFNGSADLSEDLTATAMATYSHRNAQGRSGTGYGFEENPFAPFNTFTQRQLDYGPDSYMRDYRRPGGQQRGWNYLGISGARGPETQFNFTDNPYIGRYENYQTDDEQRIYGKAQVGYDFVESLSGQFQVTADNRTERRDDRLAEISTENPPGYEESIYEVQEIGSELRFDYTQQLTEEIDLNSFAASRVRYETFHENVGETTNGLSAPGVFTLENSVGRPDVTDNFEEKMVYSVYGSVDLGYNDIVYLEGTLRNDWSSTLPEDNNSYMYPSVSANFNFTSLEALQGQDILSYGKIRASWARVGNDTDPYQLGTTFPVETPFVGQPLQRVQRDSNNPNLKPEITTGIEFGADLEFFNDRASLSTTYYRDVTRDQILNVDVSAGSGFESSLVNAGEISNRGLEASLTVTPVLTEAAQWDITANFNKNVNKVVELAEGISTYNIAEFTVFGPSVQAREGEAYGALVGPALVRDQNGEVVFNETGSPLTTSDNRNLGNFQPDWTGGLSTSFSYEGLTLNALVNGQMGGNIWSVSNMFGMYSGLLEKTVEDNQRETGVIPDGVVLPDGTSPENASEVEGIPFGEAVGRVPAATYWKNWFLANGRQEAFMYDATYLKLQEVAISYALPQEWFSGTGLQRANVALTGGNLLFLYKEAPNIDPSVTLGAGNVQGVEAAQVPSQRTYGFRLNLSF